VPPTPGAVVAPHGVNLVVHKSNPRYESDLDIVVQHRVPFVITCLGHPGRVVDAVHAYGGTVFCDVTSAEHARKSMDAGVDGLICVGAGAGGHASAQSSFSLVREIRQFWHGCLVLGGALNDGWQIRAAEVLGADLAYVGTRFLATQESNAQADYKQMVVDATVADLVYTDRLSGVHANFLRASLERHGIDVSLLPPKRPDMSSLADHSAKLWKDLWSAGHGVATIDDVPTVAALVDRMVDEYRQACALPPSEALAS
jgi:nitronate monooxygenase